MCGRGATGRRSCHLGTVASQTPSVQTNRFAQGVSSTGGNFATVANDRLLQSAAAAALKASQGLGHLLQRRRTMVKLLLLLLLPLRLASRKSRNATWLRILMFRKQSKLSELTSDVL